MTMSLANDEFKFKPVKTKSATEAIYEQIKNMIISGELKPETKLPSEREMTEMFQRSRPTIRETLKRLEQAGLVKLHPGSSGATVTAPSTSLIKEQIENMLALNQVSIEELIEFRLFNEPENAARAALHCTDDDISKIESVILAEEQILTSNPENYTNFLSYDIKFHSLITNAGKNRVFSLIGDVIGNLVSIQLSQMVLKSAEKTLIEHGDRILNEHKGIFSAIKNHDEALARELMREHISHAEA